MVVDRAEYEHLRLDAEAWRLLNRSPHVAELLAEWIEWVARQDFRQTSSAISAAADWRTVASTPTYTELKRRRSVPVVPRRCAGSGCRVVVSVPYPAPAHDVFCPGCRRATGVAA
ncbi:hypothetical protein [Amycolatopsis cihanbeyliensis]|uniref:hypothetical protein n=1 Tax=Amycolatopsis cihanbeyliensis TaxID=1128664 RepID=UPI00114E277D|nr:hypothetical protein [Amycolatopsis cihanbeyliensis]